METPEDDTQELEDQAAGPTASAEQLEQEPEREQAEGGDEQ